MPAGGKFGGTWRDVPRSRAFVKHAGVWKNPKQAWAKRAGVWQPVFSLVKSKVGSFNTGTGSTAIAVTGLGFQPKLLLFFWSGSVGTTDVIVGGDQRRGVGFAVSPSMRGVVAQWDGDNLGTSLCSRSMFNDCCVELHKDDIVDGKLDLTSMDADGFTLAVDNAFGWDYRIHYLAIGGDDVVASGGLITTASAPANYDVTTLGTAPGFLGMISHGYNTMGNANNDSNNNRNMYAFSDLVGDVSMMLNPQKGAANANIITALFNTMFYMANVTQATTSPLSNGFRTAFSLLNAVNYFLWFTLHGVKSKVGTFLTRTDTTPQAITGLGFSPAAIIFMSHGDPGINNEASRSDRGSVGAVDASLGQRVASAHSQNGPTTTVVGVGHNSAGVYQTITDTDVQDGLMQINSLDGDGFTFQMSDPDPAARYVAYAAIG